jgi:hypothetical protein
MSCIWSFLVEYNIQPKNTSESIVKMSFEIRTHCTHYDTEEIKVKLFNKYLLKTITIPPDLVLTFLLCEAHIIIW